MNHYGQNDGQRRRRAAHTQDPMQAEPSMSAPSPMPGKPAATYMPPSPAIPPQTEWQPPQDVPQTWNASQSVSGYAGYPVQQGYNPPPSQGIPGGQLPPRQYGWQQSYTPAQDAGIYQQPTGRGWSQPHQGGQQQEWQGGYSAGPWSPNGYTPAYDETPIGSGDGGNGGQGLSRSTLIKLIAAAVAVVIAVVVVVNLINQQNQTQALYAAVDAYRDLYCQGVYVDGIHLGGMTREQARAEVLKSAQLKCDEWNVQLLTGAGEYVGEINSYHLGMTVHVDDALNEAWMQGHTGTTYQARKAEMDALLVTPYHTSTALPSGDTAAIDRILGEIANRVYVPATDAYATFDPRATNPFTIIPETMGRYLDVNGIKAHVYDMVSRMESGVVSVEPTILYPAVTQADVQRKTTLIGSHYTPISSTSTENRNLNIQRASELINGKEIKPGEQFSFNNVVGPRSKKNGFYTAIEYAYGQQVEGYGGGVCQVSSTIYVAAVRANMEIVRRTQHALEVGYTTFGLDATVNLDGKVIDFVFKNNTDSSIYITTRVLMNPRIDKNHYLVTCNIYGPALEEGVTYDLVATQVEVPIPEPTTVPDKKAEHATYVDEAITIPGKIGYEVDSYKIKYVNGEEVERIHMYHDTYEPVKPVTYVGVSERPLPTDEPIEE